MREPQPGWHAAGRRLWGAEYEAMEAERIADLRDLAALTGEAPEAEAPEPSYRARQLAMARRQRTRSAVA